MLYTGQETPQNSAILAEHYETKLSIPYL